MQFKKQEIREKILDAAKKDFYKNGFEKTTMRHIARAAQVSVSNVYNYFNNKSDLFYEITTPFYDNFSKLISDLTYNASEEDFSAEYVESVIKIVGELVKRNRVELEILMDRSNGTKYEKLKYELIKIFEEHFKEHIKAYKGKNWKETENSFIFHLIASNLIEAMLEISRHYVNEEWVDNNIEALIKYHLFGITQFYE